MKVAIDQDRCRGHGVCWTICPGEFEDAVHSAAVNCPERAIVVR